MERLEKFRKLIAENDLDGFIVTSPENRRYLWFSRFVRVLVIDQQRAVLYTDFRYLEQAGEQTAHSGFEVKEHEPEDLGDGIAGDQSL